MINILILGGSGLVGRAIIDEMNMCNGFKVYSTFFHNPIANQERCFKLNIENSNDIVNILNVTKPNCVVSCLRGNFNNQLDIHVKVAEHLKKHCGKLYFFSTTNVFDNDMSRPHYENDAPNSCTDYGNYKLECENRITNILGDNACILRIPQVWDKNSPRMNELLTSIRNNKEVIVYPKLFHNTNTNTMIARQLSYIISNNLNGIFHLASQDVVNHKDFYYELISRLGFNNVNIKDDFEAEGYFALLSNRYNHFPKELRITNKSVIDCLVN